MRSSSRSADIVGYSFVSGPMTSPATQGELEKRGAEPGLALIAKIETALAVQNLPELIVQGAGAQPLGIMIARGDLMVEVGHRRMAEIQEELLWLCEAAHAPVIWATQVLDNFVKKGVRNRAEMTDAAMAERAECVMLNKGPYAGEAVRLLDDVLGRMEGHQFKKTARMRALRLLVGRPAGYLLGGAWASHEREATIARGGLELEVEPESDTAPSTASPTRCSATSFGVRCLSPCRPNHASPRPPSARAARSSPGTPSCARARSCRSRSGRRR